MRLVLLIGALVGAWIVYRRRLSDERRVVVAWEDGSEITLDPTSPERDRLVGIAQGALE